MTRSESAVGFFKQGYNCSQAVVLAFSDLLNIDRSSLLKLSSSFGGGLARLREVCGAVSGMAAVAGLLYGYDTPETGEVKASHYALVQNLAHRFEEQVGSIICRDILKLAPGPSAPEPTPRTPDFYEKRPCIGCIAAAAEILDAFITENR